MNQGQEPMVDKPMVSVDGVRYVVGDRAVLDGASLQVRAGESVAVTGPSGSGKSTLLMCLLGLLKPQSGSIRVAGQEITALSGRALAAHRRRNVGMIFQFGELLPELSPLENVALPALLGGVGRRQARAAAHELLRWLGVAAEGTPTGLLSGGERQRTAVARALITGPPVLLADEPTGALDHRARTAVAEFLFSVPRERGCALVVVTHDAAVAAGADRLVALESGRLAGSTR